MQEYLSEQHEIESRVKPGMLRALKDRLVQQIKSKWVDKRAEALHTENRVSVQADARSGQQLPSGSPTARASGEENVPTRPSTPTDEDGPTCPSTPTQRSTSHDEELLEVCFAGEPSMPQPPSPTPDRPSLVLNFRKATPGSPWTVVKPSNKGKGKEKASSLDTDSRPPSHQLHAPSTIFPATPAHQAPCASTSRTSEPFMAIPGSSQPRSHTTQPPSQPSTIAGTSSKPFASTTLTSIQTSVTPTDGFSKLCQWTPAPQPFIRPATASSIAEPKPFSSAPISVTPEPTHMAPTSVWEPHSPASNSSGETAPTTEIDTAMDEPPSLEPSAFRFSQSASSSGVPPPPVAFALSWQNSTGSSPAPPTPVTAPVSFAQASAYNAPGQAQNASPVGNSPASLSMQQNHAQGQGQPHSAVFASATPTMADIEMDHGVELQFPGGSDPSPSFKISQSSLSTPPLQSQWHIPAHQPQEQSTIPAFSLATTPCGSQPALFYAGCSIHCNFGPGSIVLCQHLAPSLLPLISQQAAFLRNIDTSTNCSPIPQSQPVFQTVVPPEIPVHRTECGLLHPRPEPPRADILGLSTYAPPPSLPQEPAPAESSSTYEEILAKEIEIYLKWQKSVEEQAPIAKGRKVEEPVYLDLPKRDSYKLVDFRPKESLSDSERKCIKILEDQRREAARAEARQVAVQAHKAHKRQASRDRTTDADSEEATRGRYAKRRKQVQEAEGKLVNTRKQVRASSRRKVKPRPWGVFGVQYA